MGSMGGMGDTEAIPFTSRVRERSTGVRRRRAQEREAAGLELRASLGLPPPPAEQTAMVERLKSCLLYTSPSPRDSTSS
eukprot:7912555-Prorocentrum_lima.AAC.1